jgi:hypothetical protein
MILYLQTDPATIDHSNLDQRLNSDLKTIKPTVMKADDNLGYNNGKFNSLLMIRKLLSTNST